jgi:hypothetical protein
MAVYSSACNTDVCGFKVATLAYVLAGLPADFINLPPHALPFSNGVLYRQSPRTFFKQDASHEHIMVRSYPNPFN